MTDIFISYRRTDAAGHARALHRDLCLRFSPDRIFFDRESIESGEKFHERIRAAVTACQVLLALIGPGWLNAQGPDGSRRLDDSEDVVRGEIALALRLNKSVIPVLFDDVPMTRPDELPSPIKPLAGCDLLNLRGKTYEYDVQLNELVRLLAKVPGMPGSIEALKEAEAAFRRRVRKRFAEDAFYYIPLRGETTEPTADRIAGHVPPSVQRRCRRIKPALREVVEEGREMRRVQLNNLREAVDKYRCVILLGDPGCGKTTVVEHLAYELAVENGLLPLPLRLGGFEPEMAVEEFIGDGWAGPESADHWNWSSPELASGLGDYLEAGKLFFLFDGLNEMPPEGYAERVRALRRFINRWSTKGNRFVVTCRVVDYGDQLTGLKRVEIQPFSDQQIKDFYGRTCLKPGRISGNCCPKKLIHNAVC